MQLPLTLLFTLLPFFLDVQAKEHNGRKLVNAAQLTTPARILAAGSGKESDGTFSGRLMMKRAVSGRDLFKRAGECADPVQYLCENVDGCCDPGYQCGIFNDIPGCCPDGERCNALSGCAREQISCGDSCCPGGSECVTLNNIPTCAVVDGGSATTTPSKTTTAKNGSPTDSDPGCPAGGYKQCLKFAGCCPIGVECVDGGSCDITCKETDPVCGSGCCPDGFICDTEKEACIAKTTDLFTSIEAPTATTTSVKTKTTVSDKEDVTAASTKDAESQPTETKADQGSGAGNRLEGTWIRSLGGLVGIAVGGMMFL